MGCLSQPEHRNTTASISLNASLLIVLQTLADMCKPISDGFVTLGYCQRQAYQLSGVLYGLLYCLWIEVGFVFQSVRSGSGSATAVIVLTGVNHDLVGNLSCCEAAAWPVSLIALTLAAVGIPERELAVPFTAPFTTTKAKQQYRVHSNVGQVAAKAVWYYGEHKSDKRPQYTEAQAKILSFKMLYGGQLDSSVKQVSVGLTCHTYSMQIFLRKWLKPHQRFSSVVFSNCTVF